MCFAGTFQGFQGAGATPGRDRSGWFGCTGSLPDRGSNVVDANGYTGAITLRPVDGKGNLAGSILGNPIYGLSDAYNRVVFQRIIDPSNRSKDQLYEGYGWTEGTLEFARTCFAGSFQGFQGTGATPQRNKSGWFYCENEARPAAGD